MILVGANACESSKEYSNAQACKFHTSSVHNSETFDTLHTLSLVNIAKLDKKAQITQRETHDSGACLKAHYEQNLSSRIPAVDFDTMIMKASIYSASFALARVCNQSHTADSGKIMTF